MNGTNSRHQPLKTNEPENDSFGEFSTWRPPVDIIEEDNQMCVFLELPGLKKRRN